MTLLDSLTSRPRLSVPDFRNTSAFDAASTAVKEAFPDYDLGKTLSINEIVQRLSVCMERWEWAGLKVGDIAVLMRAVFAGELSLPASLTSFLEREALATSTLAFMAPLCEAYLAGWERSSGRSLWLAGILRSRMQDLPPTWRRCFEDCPELLDSDAADLLVASRIVDEADPFAWLSNIGIAAPHSGKLMRGVHFEWLRQLPDPVSKGRVEQIFKWMYPTDQPPLDGDLAASAIEKLLRPWVERLPPIEFRGLLISRIVETFGDPRNQRPDFWPLVSEPCRRVVIRWLAGASMDALLSVIEQSTSNHMWPPRHRFWKGLYDRGLIDEACIVLSPAAHDDAMALYARTGNEIYTMVSRQITKSLKRDTCLLIMRIGRYTVLEGSHDYRVHVFQANDPAAPVLYEPVYDAGALMLEQFHPDTRIHDHWGNWRTWVEGRVLGSRL